MKDETTSDNPAREMIAKSPMSLRQFVIVGLCCLINMSDGYDVLSLGLAAPQLGREWGFSPEILGMAFSATSVGLVIGAFFLAPLADRIGRRAIVLIALADISLVHWLSAASGNIWMILVLRFFLGIGLGALVVSLNVIVSEYSNERWRSILIATLHTGFSVGMAISGLVAALVLESIGWRYIFIVGGIFNFSVFLLALMFLLESPEYLTGMQPKNALERVNKVLRQIRHAPLPALPPKAVKERKKIDFAGLLEKGARHQTLMIWIASFTYAIVGYFLMNWKPQMLVNAGLSPAQASYVGIINGACGTIGHLAIAVLTRWFSETRLTAFFFAMLTVMLIVFGTVRPDPVLLLATSGVITLFTVGAYTGIFLVAIKFYTVETRNTGVGFVVGWGRLGSIFGPMLGGLLVGAGLDRAYTFATFAAISVIPVVAMLMATGGRLAPTARQKGEGKARPAEA